MFMYYRDLMGRTGGFEKCSWICIMNSTYISSCKPEGSLGHGNYRHANGLQWSWPLVPTTSLLAEIFHRSGIVWVNISYKWAPDSGRKWVTTVMMMCRCEIQNLKLNMVLTCRHNLWFAVITTGVNHFFTSTDDFTGHRHNMSGRTI